MRSSVCDKNFQEERAAALSRSSTFASDGGNMAFWSGSVNAAEAKKADGASICALLTHRPPFRIGRDA